MGRSHTPAGLQVPDSNPPCLSLGEDKTVSRSHLQLNWDEKQRRWVLHVTGKNGFWYGSQKIAPPATNEESKSSIPADSPSSLTLSSRRASQLRIGLGDDACIIYFAPALKPAERKKSSPKKDGGETPTVASSAPKKRKKPAASGDAEPDTEGAAGSSAADKPQQKKKRKKATPTLETPSSSPPVLTHSNSTTSDLTRTFDPQ